MTIESIQADFEFLDDWEDRYRYVIELGRDLAPLDAAEKSDASKVRGCASQVWLICERADPADDPVLTFRGESDALIVGYVHPAAAQMKGFETFVAFRAQDLPRFALRRPPRQRGHGGLGAM